jgi:CRP-like cAMP-binding protein
MDISQSLVQNHLLAALPADDFARLAPHLELVELTLGAVIREAGRAQDDIYFPATAIISLFYLLEDGASTEIAMIGNKGVVGIWLFLGGETTPSRAMVRSAGFAYRVPGKVLKAEFNRGGAVLQILLRYAQALLTQTSQIAVCNRYHSVEQQLCRWLLLSLDRLPGDDMSMTHELIANMLGVRREGVTEAAGNLQRAGLIQYSRGHIEVLDRPGLEKTVCECYAAIKNEYERLITDIPPGDPDHVLG